MEAITVGQIASAFGLIAGVIASSGAIYAIFAKIMKKKIKDEIKEITEPIISELNAIKAINAEQSKKQEELKTELILMAKINQAMINELKNLGHVNGDTAQALQNYTEFLMSR